MDKKVNGGIILRGTAHWLCKNLSFNSYKQTGAGEEAKEEKQFFFQQKDCPAELFLEEDLD